MDEGGPVPVPSNDHPPIDVGPYDDEQGESAALILNAPEQAPFREEDQPFDHGAIASIESASRLYSKI
jgi:hypothetical protein